MSILIGNCTADIVPSIAHAQHWRCCHFASFGIELCMRWLRHLATCLLTASLLCGLLQAATSGSFRGTVVEGDNGAPHEGWLYVRGKNGSIRRVDISQAEVSYDEAVPNDQRKSSVRDQLVIGAEVRVTAEQGTDGEWRASRVEIVKPAPAGVAGTTALSRRITGVRS